MDNLMISLEHMNLDGYSESNRKNLRGLLRLVNPFLESKYKPTRKADIVELLYAFYTDPQSAEKLYNGLTKYEKALMQCIVHSKYKPLAEDLAALAKTYNFKPDKPKPSYYYSSTQERDLYYPKNTLLDAFFPNNAIPDAFREYLDNIVPPYVRQFLPCEVDDEEYISLIGRENRYKDFDMLVRFVNNQNVPTTKAGGYMSKSALLKFYNAVGFSEYDELLAPDVIRIQDIRNAEQTTVCFALVQLLRCANVLDIFKDRLVPCTSAIRFSKLTMPEKAKFLFDAYIDHKGDIIAECFRISSSKLKFSRSRHNLSSARREIVSMLKECPVNVWIDFTQLSKELRKSNTGLFAAVGDVMIRDDYYNSYYDRPDWDSFEHCAISVILQEYLATLGAVDVLVEEVSHSDYEQYSMYETAYFRITDLGAYLFGITDSYVEKQLHGPSADEKGFIVQPNFDILIPNGKDRMQHELFFDRFAEKVTDDAEISVYKLDFKCIVKAVNLGLYIREICSYCEIFSSVPVPDNVKTAFDEWEAQSKRLRIRTVSILESDDAILLEEIKNYRGMGALTEDRLAPVLVLNPGSEKKAKTLIEKNKRFCKLEV